MNVTACYSLAGRQGLSSLKYKGENMRNKYRNLSDKAIVRFTGLIFNIECRAFENKDYDLFHRCSDLHKYLGDLFFSR